MGVFAPPPSSSTRPSFFKAPIAWLREKLSDAKRNGCAGGSTNARLGAGPSFHPTCYLRRAARGDGLRSSAARQNWMLRRNIFARTNYWVTALQLALVSRRINLRFASSAWLRWAKAYKDALAGITDCFVASLNCAIRIRVARC